MQIQTPDSPAMLWKGLGPYGAMVPRFDGAGVSRFARKWLEGQAADLGMAPEEMRQDATLSMAFARQLEYIIKRVYEAQYPQLRATEFLPVNTEVPPGALTFTYRRVDIGAAGQAKIVNSFSDDLPKADVNAKEWQSPIVTLGSSYEWSVQDLASAAFSGIPIEAYKARASRFAIDFLLEKIAAIGDANSGVPGFLNAPGLPVTAQTPTSLTAGKWTTQLLAIGAATSSNPYPATAVVANILADINAMIQAVVTATKFTRRPTNMLVPLAVYSLLETTPRSPVFTNDSVLSYIEEMTNLDVDFWPSIDQYAQGTVIVYTKTEDVIELMISQPFTQLPPQPKNLAWQVPTMMRTGGVQLREPLSATTMTGLA